MATTMVIEEERGTTSGYRHPHNGYYAGDFFPRAAAVADTSQVPDSAQAASALTLVTHAGSI
jgi:hypothetical protein